MASCSFDLGGDAEIVLSVDGSAVNQIGGSSRNTQSISKMALKAELYDGNALVASDTRPVSDNTDSINFTFPKLKSGKKYSVKMKVTGNLLYTMDNGGFIEPVSRTLNNFVIASGSADCVVKNGENAVSVILEFTPFEDVKAAFAKAYKGEPVNLTLKSDVLWTEPLSSELLHENKNLIKLSYDLNGFTLYNMIFSENENMLSFSGAESGSRFAIKNGNVVTSLEGKKGSFVYVDAQGCEAENLYLDLEKLNVSNGTDEFIVVNTKGAPEGSDTGSYNAHVTINGCSFYDGNGNNTYGVTMTGQGTLFVSDSTLSGFNSSLLIEGTECILDNTKVTSRVPNNVNDNVHVIDASSNCFILLTGGTVIKTKSSIQCIFLFGQGTSLVLCGAEVIQESIFEEIPKVDPIVITGSGGNGDIIFTDSIEHQGSVYKSHGFRNRVVSEYENACSILASSLLTTNPVQVGISGSPEIQGKIKLVYEEQTGRKALINKIGDWGNFRACVEIDNATKQVFQLAKDNTAGLVAGTFHVEDVSYEEAVSHFDLYCAETGMKKVFVDWTKEEEGKYTQIELVDDEPSGGSGEVITF
ncbi:MAG: hypothetical protein MJ176_09155 [Treponema sp.]|nr:hypothetical protein [Treponema sp.]